MGEKIFTLFLVVMMLVTLPVTALAAEQPTAAEVFTGYSLTITDTTTPATTIQTERDLSTTYFLSVDGRRLGSMAYSDMRAIINKYEVIVQLEGGGSIGVTPDGRTVWNSWFADLFNEHRGLGLGSREAATNTHQVNTVEEYRLEVVRLTNEARAEAGLPALAVDDDAMAYAQIRAEEISTHFSHERLNGQPKEVNGLRPNENITAAGLTPEEAVNAWMNSEGHRGNILNLEAYAIGVGAYQTSTGNWYWTQEFIW